MVVVQQRSWIEVHIGPHRPARADRSTDLALAKPMACNNVAGSATNKTRCAVDWLFELLCKGRTEIELVPASEEHLEKFQHRL
jgi:hypothetical protein